MLPFLLISTPKAESHMTFNEEDEIVFWGALEPHVYVDDKVETEVENLNSVACSCVKTVRLHGVDIPRGDAWELEVNSSTPEEGAVVKMQYSSTAHVALVTEVTEEGMWIVEGNYHRCQVGKRFLPNDYPHIVGFWKDDQTALRTIKLRL